MQLFQKRFEPVLAEYLQFGPELNVIFIVASIKYRKLEA